MIRIDTSKKTKSYMAYAILLSIFITKYALVTYLVAAIGKIPIIGEFSNVILHICIFILGITAYRTSMIRYVRVKDVLVPIFVLMAILVTWVVYPQNMKYLLQNYSSYIAFCIPAFIVGLTSTEYDERMFRIVSIVSVISLACSYLYTFMYLSTSTFDELGQSYSVLPGTLFIIGYYLHSKKTLYLVASIAGVAYAFMLGSRGPILLIAVFLVSGILLIDSNLSLQKVITVLSILLAVLVFIYSGAYLEALNTAKNYLAGKSISTRVIDFMISGEYISYTSGRTDLYDKLLLILQDRPYLGYGLFGEWNFIGWNAHEIYLEVVFEYGWPIGVLLIVWYMLKVIPTFFIEREAHNRVFILVFIVYVLVQGIMSYSHLRLELFLLLGFCLKQRRAQKYTD